MDKTEKISKVKKIVESVLQKYIGELNNQETRNKIKEEIIEDVRENEIFSEIICDSNNNKPFQIDNGWLIVDVRVEGINIRSFANKGN